MNDSQEVAAQAVIKKVREKIDRSEDETIFLALRAARRSLHRTDRETIRTLNYQCDGQRKFFDRGRNGSGFVRLGSVLVIVRARRRRHTYSEQITCETNEDK